MRTLRLLDFGCGTGSSTPYLLNLTSTCEVTGVTVSAMARRQHGSNRAKFALSQEWLPRGEIDLAFSNRVFHQIALNKRAACVDYVFKSLDSGGLFAFWENNPWNPGTRYVKSRNSFDRDAIKFSPREARRLLQKAGFEIARIDSLFYFPRLARLVARVER